MEMFDVIQETELDVELMTRKPPLHQLTKQVYRHHFMTSNCSKSSFLPSLLLLVTIQIVTYLLGEQETSCQLIDLKHTQNDSIGNLSSLQLSVPTVSLTLLSHYFIASCQLFTTSISAKVSLAFNCYR